MTGDRGRPAFPALRSVRPPSGGGTGLGSRSSVAPAGAAPGGSSSGRRRFTAALSAFALLVGSAAVAQVGAPTTDPGWAQLSAQQREALAPLAGQWATMPADSKRKWLEIATKYPQLSPEGKAKMQSRMAEFARLTPEQRRTTRENFQRAYELPLENRESAVQQFQLLPEEKKKQLTEQRNPRKDVPRPGDAKK